MNKEILNQLTTGDKVVHKATEVVCMITAVSPKIDGILTVEDLVDDIDNWEMGENRLYLSDKERRKIEDFHEKSKKMTINK